MKYNISLVTAIVLGLSRLSAADVISEEGKHHSTQATTSLGGGVIGNGTDGEDLSTTRPEVDVSQPTQWNASPKNEPSKQPGSGYLRIQGLPGLGQEDKVRINSCELNKHHMPTFYGCTEVKSEDGKPYRLNSQIKLSTGTYSLSYSGSFYPVATVNDSVETVIELKTLRIPNLDRDTTFVAFSDLTNKKMQHSFLLRNFERALWKVEMPDMWAEFKSYEWRAYPGFQDVGGTWKLDAVNSEVAPPVAKDFVSVFPGIYGIKFIKDGQNHVNLGIKVE